MKKGRLQLAVIMALAGLGMALSGLGLTRLVGGAGQGSSSPAGLATSVERSPALADSSTLTAGRLLRGGPAAREAPAVTPNPNADSESTPDDGIGDTSERPGAVPLRVRIPSIGVDSSIVDLGLNPDGTLEVPEDYAQTGWYTGRSTPGDAGPSVVVGHVDSWTGPAVFFRLDELEPGATIEIARSDGHVSLFEVSEAVLVEKDEFPTERVYGDTALPTLRLITCGGPFDHTAKSYTGNLIVYAAHIGTRPAIRAIEVA